MSPVHHWASATLVALEFGAVAESSFEAARRQVDEFVRAQCPKAAEQLLAAEQRLQEGDAEALSAALTACRRLFMTIADAVFPARAEPRKDRLGKTRVVDQDAYKNRLLAFMEERIASDSTLAILEAQIGHAAERLDAVYEKACKGVHANITEAEARLAVMETYLLLSEVARLSTTGPSESQA